MQEIALVLARVGPLEQLPLPVEVGQARIVARGELGRAEPSCVGAQRAELDFSVAENVGIGCAPGSALGEKVFKDTLAILVAEIDAM